jgi:nicotinate dehydrogenase subunit A
MRNREGQAVRLALFLWSAFADPLNLDKATGRCDDFSPAGARKVDVMPSFTLNVNGESRTVEVRDPDEPLLYVLRNSLSLTGAKFGCGLGQCGACTVIVDDEAVRSCRMTVSKAAGKKITTIEGLGTHDKPHPLQAAFVAEQAAQCGYCVTGMVMTGAAALARKPNLSREDAQQALAGNLCRCGTHDRILRAMLRASGKATT